MSVGDTRAVAYSFSNKYLKAITLGKNKQGVSLLNLRQDHYFIVISNHTLWQSLSDLDIGKLLIPYLYSQNT